MDDDARLIQLIEQAACCFNMLSAKDLSDVQQLQDLFRQMGEAAARLDRGPADLRTELQGKTEETAQVLQHVLVQDIEDTGQALEAVSKAIHSLQELIQKLV